ncbi:stage V sporulation protein B [Oceanobacillus sp. HCA-5259]|uniref:stage V sporulation protein B n=1 Tax=Oceanobacillus sp. HCA-5259 TaxID=3134661 RepID=UPI0030BCBB0C
MTRQTFLQGALILMLAGMITRFLGFINRIVVARLIGEEGVGLYMLALPTLFLVITLTQIGLPVAIAKRVAEADAVGNHEKIRSILVVSLLITSVTSIILTIAMILGSPYIASTLLTDERTIYPLLAISPIVPIVAISSVLRGYFQGKHNMKPQSYAQVFEQIVRIVFVYIFIKLLLPYGVEFAAAGAMFSVILGEFASLMYMLYQFKLRKSGKNRRPIRSYFRNTRETMRELFSIALPSTGSRLIGSISNFLEPILVSQALAIAGVTATLVTKQYGELTGYVIPLLFLPTFITHSLAIALIPSISEAGAKNNQKLIHYRIHQAIRISFASGAIATIVLLLFSEQILLFMYGSSSANQLLILMAPFYILLYIQAPLQSALQALDYAKESMWNTLIGTFMKLLIIFVLAQQPAFGMNGVAIALSTSVILVTLLHLTVLNKKIKYHIPLKDMLKMIALFLLPFFVGWMLREIYILSSGGIMMLGLVFLLLIAIYLSVLFLLQFITKEELRAIPIFDKWLR